MKNLAGPQERWVLSVAAAAMMFFFIWALSAVTWSGKMESTAPVPFRPPVRGIEAEQSAALRQYLPKELKSVLVCITAQFNVAKLSHLEIMLLEATQYRSPSLDVLLVTDKAVALQQAVQRLMLPLNISYYQGQKPADDDNKYWLTWEHRTAIEQAVAKRNYTTVVYMEDDTRLTWRTLVSWAIDTSLLAQFNVTRCFFRTEVRPADGGLLLNDYFSAIDVRPSSPLKRLDLLVNHSTAYHAAVAQLTGHACGTFPNGTEFPCKVHAFYTATPFPFQGMWLATSEMLARFMRTPIWTKQGALTFNFRPYMHAKDAFSWGYPERSASIAVLGGLVELRPGQTDAFSSCVLPYHPRSGDRPAELSLLARIDHLRNGYGHWKHCPGIERSVIS